MSNSIKVKKTHKLISASKAKLKMNMVMQMRGDKCYPGREKWIKIPLLPENVGKGVPTTITTSEP